MTWKDIESVSDVEADYLDALKDYASPVKVRMTLFQMLARSQLSQADVITLATYGLSEVQAFTGCDVCHDAALNRRVKTLASLVMATIRNDFDASRPELDTFARQEDKAA